MDYYPNELYHHGIKGMKWGVRRYQNPDGSLTAAGRLRYGAGQVREGVRRAASSAKSYGSDAYKKAKATYNRKVTKADIGKIAATAGVVAVAALAVKHRGAIKVGAKIAGRYAKVGVSKLSGSAVTKGKAFVSQAKFDAGRMKNVARLKTKTATAKAKVGIKSKANQVKQNAERKRRISNQVEDAFPGVRTKVRNAAGQAKFDMGRYGRVAGLKTKTAVAKAKVGAKTTLGNTKSNIARKRRIGKQVNDAFNSPSRYIGTHSPSQIRRDVARNLTERVVGTYAGAAGGAALGNYIERKSGSTTKKKKKK